MLLAHRAVNPPPSSRDPDAGSMFVACPLASTSRWLGEG